MRHIPRAQEIYRHFKGRLYQIVTVAKHSETGESFVVYQAMYGGFQTYVRPLEMFMDKVDRVKYPDVLQEYRFERMDLAENAAEYDNAGEENESAMKKVSGGQGRREDRASGTHGDNGPDNSFASRRPDKEPGNPSVGERPGYGPGTPSADERPDSVSGNSSAGERPDFMSGNSPFHADEGAGISEEAEELNIDPMVLEFLDASAYSERLNILAGLHYRITDDMIDVMAMATDIEVKPGDIEERYVELRNCLLKLEKYECNRLRN